MPSPLDLLQARELESSTGRAQPGILLLDDDIFMLGVQSRMLRSMGYPKISTAGSAELALLMLQQPGHGIDVVFCDLYMPGIDGIEFLQRLSASPFAGCVILLSGQDVRIMHTVQRLLDGSRLRILGAMVKPAQRSALAMLLECWQQRSQAPAEPPPLAVECADLRAAHHGGQWALRYQPMVDLQSGRPCAVEVAVHWLHPRLGPVPPESFVELLEPCEEREALLDSVLTQCLRQVASWRLAGLGLKVALDVPVPCLASAGFARRVHELTRSSCAAPEDVVFELSERRLTAPAKALLENLARLRMQRFGVSIDDYGRGHSSLSQLIDIPFSELKIDRRFVRGARVDQVIRPVLEGSVGLARRLRARTVAVGVDAEDDWHAVREAGCDAAQGSFIGCPMPADQLPAWIRQWQSRRDALGAA